MTTGESANHQENIKSYYAQYSAALDADTEFWSGNFDRYEAFGRVVALREAALPLLLAELADRSDAEDRHNPWWRLQAVGTIAAQLDKKIDYPREIRGRVEPIREATLEWGVRQGYIDPDQAEFA
ncbi:MAG TPA: hypothetical protein VHC21_01290 [Candidatus Saccharimonadales bacterium]|nr:hypothetical protein [Candidatus Saccharimonadales bacterium]